MRSRRKQGMSGPRYRAHNSGKLKGLPTLRANRARAAMRKATEIRCRMEREKSATRNSLAPMSETTALRFFAGLPSVFEIAGDILSGRVRA
mgnify:CR=1 FL=1